ncbi:uncharacterized protein A4U43_C04F34750 [Asparagus officinalis]|uniref:Protein kinase domain-containing protein n=1 Tax=Asparagus officinalis TaxID=4686 RepID=A0A5P1F5V7_ASPOF|nr:uncharacterized protein A4U43_C04F34750 [Asparagus officinalis]
MEEAGKSKSDGGSLWASFGGAFKPYTSMASPASTADGGSSAWGSLRVVVRRPTGIFTTNLLVWISFKQSFLVAFALPHVRTPSRDGILEYFVKDLLGHGTFGQVVKCWVPESDSYVAVKVIKNHAAYYRQALVEVSILTTLNQNLGHDEKRHIVRILDYFIFQRHLCISFEMLGSNLYEVIKMNQYRGIPLSLVQVFSKQILHALVVIKEAGIIHCDLKPENILLSTSTKPEIKVIDFGSACMEGHTVYSYIQSRYYRSPEVLLGYPYTTAIDMWSFGCIVAELFLGLPLFSGASEYDLLKRMIEILGGQPPDDLLRDAKDTNKFFKHVASIYHLEEAHKGNASAYRILTEEEYEARVSQKPIIGKRYFSKVKLEDIIASYPYKKNLSEEEISKENISRLALVDFLRGLVEFDPGKRWSPLQASRHPFVTGEPFMYPYQPPPETSRIPVVHSVIVDHNPGGGHWVAAGLSPQVPSSNRFPQHNSPHFHMVPMSHGSSFGSLGSHGSYNDHTGLGSSYGSYGDVNNMYSYFSPVGPGVNIQTQVGGPFLGASPDTRRRPHMSHGNGFGMSPTGSLGPMSLGASPSQFTPPSSQMQIPTVSPGKYGPTSPARGSVHGSPLSKAAAVSQYSQYNRRRSWGHHGTSSMQPHENASPQWQGNQGDDISCQSDALARGHVGSPCNTFSATNHSSWRQQTGPSTNNQGFPASRAFNTNALPSRSTEVSHDKLESSSSVPDPADWDPNYSDELLLQEDNSEANSLAFGITRSVCLGNATDASVLNEAGKSSQSHSQARINSSFVSSNQRIDGASQVHSRAESGSHYAHSMHAAHSRLPPFSQNSLSRFGQPSSYRHNQYSNFSHGERIHHKGQRAPSNFSGPHVHSAAQTMFSGGTSWGRRDGHNIPTTLPSHARKEYGRMS